MMVMVAEQHSFARQTGRGQATRTGANYPHCFTRLADGTDMPLKRREAAPTEFAPIIKGLYGRINGLNSWCSRPPNSGGGNLDGKSPRLKLFKKRVGHLFHSAQIRALQQSSDCRRGDTVSEVRRDIHWLISKVNAPGLWRKADRCGMIKNL